MEFNADDMVTVVLAAPANPDDEQLALQDFMVNGKPMIPFYTSHALLEEAIDGKEFPYEVIDIEFGYLMELMNGDENLAANLGTSQAYAFNVRDLTGE
jgi:hypothetical protein